MADPKLLHETGELNPWLPDNNRQNLRVLGKLGEELGEGVSAVNRAIIQGIDEAEPVTGKVNRQWLTEEIGDIVANIDMVIDHFKLDRHAIQTRKSRKIAHLEAWAEMIKDA